MLKTLFVKANGFSQTGRVGAQARYMASVAKSATRQTPVPGRPRATPISHERATLTIKVGIGILRFGGNCMAN